MSTGLQVNNRGRRDGSDALSDWPAPTRRMNPDEVQTVLQEIDRAFEHEVALNDYPTEWQFPDGTETIREFCALMESDLNCFNLFRPRWRDVAEQLNVIFNVDVPMYEWRRVLHEYDFEPVTTLFEFISERTQIECIEPCRIMGRSCREAGAFRALRQALKYQGRDVSAFRPSTRMRRESFPDLGSVLMAVTRIAPRRISGRHEVHQSRLRLVDPMCLVIAALALFSAPLFWGLGIGLKSPAMLLAALMATVTVVTASFVGRRSERLSVVDERLDNFETVADLCRAIVGDPVAAP